MFAANNLLCQSLSSNFSSALGIQPPGSVCVSVLFSGNVLHLTWTEKKAGRSKTGDWGKCVLVCVCLCVWPWKDYDRIFMLCPCFVFLALLHTCVCVCESTVLFLQLELPVQSPVRTVWHFFDNLCVCCVCVFKAANTHICTSAMTLTVW